MREGVGASGGAARGGERGEREVVREIRAGEARGRSLALAGVGLAESDAEDDDAEAGGEEARRR